MRSFPASAAVGLLAIALSLVSSGLAAETNESLRRRIPSLREENTIQQEWLKLRLERNLPPLMRKHGVAMWIVACREYAEDPAFYSLISPTVFSARRLTVYVFNDLGPEKGVERLALGGDSNGGLYTVYRDPDAPTHEIYGESQWTTLKKLVMDRKPSSIAIDISETHAFSDGLSVGLYRKLVDTLGPDYAARLVPAENLALEYQEMRVPEMLPQYRNLMEIDHALISRAFSNEVIIPGKTTDQDVVWWLRQQVKDLGLGTWFHCSVMVQRKGRTGLNFLEKEGGLVIERGDVLHTDFGITEMRLNTDTQHMGYVLREGDQDVPAGLKKALNNGNRVQDIVLSVIKPGRSGNQALADALALMKEQGLRGSVYSHPIGDHGHAAGPLIGLWDRQQGVPGRGDVVFLPDSWFSIELSAITPVPEWGGEDVQMGLEEDAVLDERGKMGWVLQRQTEFHIIR